MPRRSLRPVSALVITIFLCSSPGGAAYAATPSEAEQSARRSAEQAARDRALWQAAQSVYRQEYRQKRKALSTLQRKAGVPSQVVIQINDDSEPTANERYWNEEARRMTLQKDLKRLDSDIAIAANWLKSSQRSLDSWTRMHQMSAARSADGTTQDPARAAAETAKDAEQVAKAQEARDRWAAAKELYERDRHEKQDALDKLRQKADTKSANQGVVDAATELGNNVPGMARDALGSTNDKIQSGRDQVETFSGLTSALDRHRSAHGSLLFDEAERTKLEKDLKRLQQDIDYSAKQVAYYQKSMDDYSWIANTLNTLAAMQNGTWRGGVSDRGPTTGPSNAGNSNRSSSGNTREGADPPRSGGERAADGVRGGATSSPGEGRRNDGGSSRPDRSTPDRSTPEPKGKTGGDRDNGQKGGPAIPRG